MNYQTKTSQGLKGEIRVASDKSISHRSLILAAVANGESKISNLLLSEDVLRTLTIINQLGVETSHTASNITEKDELIVQGKKIRGLSAPTDVLYCGNSGTTMRLMLGLLAGQSFSATLTGDDSLNKRPMDRIIEPLQLMGAEFTLEEKEGKRHISTVPQNKSDQVFLKGISYEPPLASAQVKSAILLAGLYAKGITSVTEPHLSRNHTELMLKSMRGKITIKDLTASIDPPQRLRALSLSIPGDISSAAFFIVAALITNNSELLIKHVSLNHTRAGIIDVLKFMGAKIAVENKEIVQGEEVGDLRVYSSKLRNISITGSIIPRLIDELPLLALAAATAQGKMIVSGANELRVKETDRIKATCSELKKIGVQIEEREDGFVIQGNPEGLKSPEGLCFESFGDHRIAMMESIAGLVLDKPVTIDDVSCVNTSFPTFFQLLDKVINS